MWARKMWSVSTNVWTVKWSPLSSLPWVTVVFFLVGGTGELMVTINMTHYGFMDGSQITSSRGDGALFSSPRSEQEVRTSGGGKEGEGGLKKNLTLSVATGRLSPVRRGASRRFLSSKTPKNGFLNEPRSTDRNRLHPFLVLSGDVHSASVLN